MEVEEKAPDLVSIPDGWSRSRLGDIISLRGGLSYKGELLSETGNSLVTMGCVSSTDRFNLAGLRRYRGEFRDVHVLRPGDMVIATRDVTQNRRLLGSPAIVPTNLPGEVAIAATNLYKVTNHSETPTEFLYWLMKTPEYRNQIIASAKGTTIVMLTKDSVENFRFALPPLPEQKAIAAILGALDDKIELNRRMNATLEAMARALFQSWFVDFDPVCAKAEGRPPAGLDEPTAALFPAQFQDSELGQIPLGWRVGTLGEVLDVLETGRRPKGGVGSYQGGVPSIGAESIWGIGKFDYSKTKFVPTEFYEKTSAGRVEHNDVLLYKDGGKPGEFRPRVGLFGHGFPFEKFSINEHVFRMRSDTLGQSYLFFAISHQRVLDDFANKGGKAAIPGINQMEVRSTQILLPLRSILEAFNEKARLWCDLVLRNAIESRTLATLRDTLLPKLLSGKITLTK